MKRPIATLFFITAAMCAAVFFSGFLAGARGQDMPEACQPSLPFGAPQAGVLLHPAGRPPVQKDISIVFICRGAYAAGVDVDLLVPRWVGYRLTADATFGCHARAAKFHPTPELMERGRTDRPGFTRYARPSDYAKSGYDLGHMKPAQDSAADEATMEDSFDMANVTPQLPGLNRQEWERLEEDVRAWAWARGEVQIFTGPGLASSGNKTLGANSGVAVPIAFWKFIYDPKENEYIVFVLPQENEPKGDVERWRVTGGWGAVRGFGVVLPLPDGARESEKAWPADLSGWKREHAKRCAR